MKKFLVLMLLAVAVLLSAVGDDPNDILNCVSSINGNIPTVTTFPYTTHDNENNAYTGSPDGDMDRYLFANSWRVPIEFNIFIDEDTINDAYLSLRVWDVDEDDPNNPEVDNVYLNGHFLGSLTGANNAWSTAVFFVDPSFLIPGPNGKNLVEIDVDVNNDHTWAVEVAWGQLVINGGQGTTTISSINTDKSCYGPCEIIEATIAIETDQSELDIKIETSLIDDENNTLDFINPGEITIFAPGYTTTHNLAIPCNTESSNYTIQVVLFIKTELRCTWVQQDVMTIVRDDCNVPVTLSAFTAIYDNAPTLQWTTQSESNNLGWNIYRSLSGNMGQANQINNLLIPGNGTTSEPTQYVYNDLSDVENNTTYWYWLESASYNGETEVYGPVTLTIQDDENQLPDLPTTSILHNNYPNPFNPSTMINFSINQGEIGSLTILNTKGQVMETHNYEAGNHQFNWDATNYSSGIYFYKLETPTYTNIKKMIMVK